jgi:aerobic-type carbon monoxide dehydrogenase small subunit (CoxS/CutS family)
MSAAWRGRIDDKLVSVRVTVNGRAATLAAMQDGKRITTIEGPERDGFQCGFCTPGQVMSAVALIDDAKSGLPSAATADVTRPFALADLSKAEIRERMSRNLCRCACYPNGLVRRAWRRGKRQPARDVDRRGRESDLVSVRDEPSWLSRSAA